MQETTRSSRFSFDTAAVWLLSATAFLTAVAIIPSDSVSLHATKVTILAVGALLAFIAFVIARLVRGSLVLPPLALLGTIWLLPIAYGLSTLFSGVNPGSAFFGVEFEADTLGFMLLLAIVATLAAVVLRRAEDYRTFFAASTASFGVVLVVQVIIILSAAAGASVAPTLNLVGSFADFGMLAGFSALASLFGLRFLRTPMLWKVLFWVGLVLSLIALVLANATIIWVFIALVSLGIFIEAILRRRGKVDDEEVASLSTFSGDDEVAETGRGGQAIGAPLVALLVALFFLIGGSTIGNAFASSLGINTLDVRPSWQSTFSVGSHTYASSPLFGSGPGTFNEQWLLYRDRGLNDTVFWNVDFASGIGSIPTSFVTTGIVGVIAWLVFIGFFLYFGVRALLFRLPQDPFLKFVALFSWTGAAYVLVLMLFSAPGVPVLALGLLSLGVFASTMRHGRGKSEWGIVFSKSPRVGFALVFLLTLLLLASVAAAYVVLERYLGSLAYGEAATAVANGDIDRAEDALSRSITFAPSERAYRLAATIGVERMRRVASDTTLDAAAAQEQFQSALTGSVNAATEATRVGPADYQNWSVLGGVYQSVAALGIAGAYEEAKNAFTRAAELNPTSPVIPYVLAQLEIGRGNAAEAEAILERAIPLKLDYVPSILLLSQLKVQLGKTAEALQAAEATAYFAPNEPAVLFQVGVLRSGTGDEDGAILALSRAVELNPQYANARFFLGAVYATQGKYPEALEQLRAVAALSPENAAAVAADITQLEAGKNPFPPARMRTLGVPTPPVAEPTPEAAQQAPAAAQPAP